MLLNVFLTAAVSFFYRSCFNVGSYRDVRLLLTQAKSCGKINFSGKIMSAFYYVEKNISFSGIRLVHEAGCQNLPQADNRIFLGSFSHISFAVQAANIRYSSSAPCLHCISRHG